MMEGGASPKHDRLFCDVDGKSVGEESSPLSPHCCWAGRSAHDLFDKMAPRNSSKVLAEERSAAALDEHGVAWLDDEDSPNMMEASRFAVVGRLLGPRLRVDQVRRVTCSKWKLLTDPLVHPIGDRLFLFRFSCEEDVRRVLDDGPWTIGGQVLFLHEWSIDYTPERHLLTKMPVWLRMPHFPIGLWNRRNIIAIAGLVGEPLEIDQSTLSQEKILFHLFVLR